MTDDNPLTQTDICCCIVKKVKPQRTPEPVGEVLEQDLRTHRFDLKSSTDPILGFVFHVLHEKLCLSNVNVEDRESQEGEQVRSVGSTEGCGAH